MKKLSVLWGVLMVSSCGLMGVGYSDLAHNSYGISFRDNTPQLQRVENVQRQSVNPKEVRTAFVGQTVISDSFFSRSVYATDEFMAKGNVVMSSASTPISFKNKETKEIIGYVTIDGVTYCLVDAGIKNYAVLVKPDGSLYKHIGKIDGSRLLLLNTTYVVSDPDFRFVTIKTTKEDSSAPSKGYELKYGGVKLDRVWFTLMTYSSGREGVFEEFNFPNNKGLVRIEDISIRILEADKDKIDYMILSN